MDHLYIVSYDVSNQRRWRRLFKAMHGYGEWLQLSVFQCRLGRMRMLELEDRIREIVNHREDHVLILDLGPAENVKPHVRSIGKSFEPVKRESVIV
ncbi:CRISPR-associated endonuclease Cas2 [Geoalkalibacter halelectricus]|uniref:CRISPR-associated endoribonuclease Cas2 n=1 Tax=Geoalkalibacter halelectricus TaxID=2847045 RepID=A0ABY5ZNF8_9BACT|nr:CRISPR-associated endonuclease Cas2 [Geoalkalibacter halelectricus]MDO3377557.1 CRISPR-associated endonuclease Cas2 [Geoalkalibacter halelectricus]UWZ80685.1 CRISPR-associated endonuclease Cas2 [Geoalkalibacter halelectricus]